MILPYLALGFAAISLPPLTKASSSGSQQWLDSSLSTEERLQSFIRQLNTTQMYAMVSGDETTDSTSVTGTKSCAGYLSGVTSLGIPAICMGDGPAGVGNSLENVTTFPAPVLSTSTWNTSAMYVYGQALGTEQRNKGRNLVLSPTINIVRSPFWARAGESFSEDPWLTSRMAVAQIKGIQSQNVIACAKHFAAHNLDTNRWGLAAEYDAINVVIDNRTLHELYFPAFKASVEEANVGSIMCAYNKVNGEYACENDYLMSVLKDDWGYDGAVMSDWYFSTRSTVKAALAGLDLSMPGGDNTATYGFPEYYGQLLIDSVVNGSVSFSRIQDMVERVWRPVFANGIIDNQSDGTSTSIARTDAHLSLAQQLAEEGIVLLKNDESVLPISSLKYQKIAIFGADATDDVQITEAHGGFATDSTIVVQSPLDAIIRRGSAEGITVDYSEAYPGTGTFAQVPSEMFPDGLNVTYWTTNDWSGEINQTVHVGNITAASYPAELWTSWPQVFSSHTIGTFMPNTSGVHHFSLTGNGDAVLYMDKVLIANMSTTNFDNIVQGVANLTAGQPVTVELYYTMGWSIMTGAYGVTLGVSEGNNTAVTEANALAESADLSIIFVSDRFSEGGDNNLGLSLPGDQDDVIARLAKISKKTLVVLNTNSAILMPWIDDVDAIMEAWYSGQQVGLALESLLFGDISPSGKLPVTFPKSLNDTFVPDGRLEIEFNEGLYIGYRAYDENNVTPLFPFGHGLTYSNFSLTNPTAVLSNGSLSNSSVVATATISNTGSMTAKQVVQLYVSYPAAANEPPKLLKGFEKVQLEVGAKTKVTFDVKTDDLHIWEENTEDWILIPGNYTFMFGFSAMNIVLEERVYLG